MDLVRSKTMAKTEKERVAEMINVEEDKEGDEGAEAAEKKK